MESAPSLGEAASLGAGTSRLPSSPRPGEGRADSTRIGWKTGLHAAGHCSGRTVARQPYGGFPTALGRPMRRDRRDPRSPKGVQGKHQVNYLPPQKRLLVPRRRSGAESSQPVPQADERRPRDPGLHRRHGFAGSQSPTRLPSSFNLMTPCSLVNLITPA